jgi:hypothetical protein
MDGGKHQQHYHDHALEGADYARSSAMMNAGPRSSSDFSMQPTTDRGLGYGRERYSDSAYPWARSAKSSFRPPLDHREPTNPKLT